MPHHGRMTMLIVMIMRWFLPKPLNTPTTMMALMVRWSDRKSNPIPPTQKAMSLVIIRTRLKSRSPLWQMALAGP